MRSQACSRACRKAIWPMLLLTAYRRDLAMSSGRKGVSRRGSARGRRRRRRRRDRRGGAAGSGASSAVDHAAVVLGPALHGALRAQDPLPKLLAMVLLASPILA